MLDVCDTFEDCNLNMIPDECELVGNDCNTNLIPDECELDCDDNDVPDECDLANGEPDCNDTGILDVCELFEDCNMNSIPDECELVDNDCNMNSIPDDCDVLSTPDCNANGIPDICDIAADSFDCNTNGIPDECENEDCNGNGIIDSCDLVNGTSQDEDGNGIPDECDCDCVNRRTPGSLLLFPTYDNRPGVITYVTVTNSGGVPGQNAVDVEYIYRREGDCAEFNRTKTFTGKDTVTLITRNDNPSSDRGYLYVFAKGPQLTANYNRPIVYNHLVGQELIIDGMSGYEYSINAVSFKGVGEEGSRTDIDFDGHKDLNDLEYTSAPDEILIPRFMGQSEDFFGMGSTVESRLLLVNLSGGRAFQTTLDFLIYNDNEEQFSREHTFTCWEEIFLLDLSEAFGNDFLSMQTNHDPNEILGFEDVESGWFRINGALAQSFTNVIIDPAFYAVLIENVGVSRGAADLPFESCSQQNGTLLPMGLFGDNED